MSPESKDLVSPEIRLIEKEIDSVYKTNHLITKSRTSSLWYLLSVFEDLIAIELHKRPEATIHDHAMIVDEYLFSINYPLSWITLNCIDGGKIPFQYNKPAYQAAQDLIKLGREYRSFVAAFTYASRGLAKLQVDGTTLIPTHNLASKSEYEAYNRLIKPSYPPLSQDLKTNEIMKIVSRSLQVKGDRFHYRLDHKLLRLAKSVLQEVFLERHSLPDNWVFSRYSLEDFRYVSEFLSTIACVHWLARLEAADRGCLGLGLIDSVYIATHDELIKRITHDSGVTESTVSAVLFDLCYGNSEVNLPDPALQPLIPVKHKTNAYAIVPNLWIGNALERNFCVLINRIPTEKQIYARLVDQKENLMRQQMQLALEKLPVRTFYGRLPESSRLPDIDLAIISDTEKVCVLLELKWFIDPAEIREVIEKTQELQKGVSQLQKLKQAFNDGYSPLLSTLHINSSYTVCCIVASANWIGHADVQNSDIAIINDGHLLDKIVTTHELKSTVDWVNQRKYLPRSGVHYDVKTILSKVGDWSLPWYGIKPLISRQFRPL